MLRYPRLPATRAEEIESMVSYEAVKQIPYSPEEVVSDYEVIGTDKEGYSEIMLAIIHKKETTSIENALGAIGKKNLRIRLSSEALMAWLRVAAKEELQGKNL